MQSISIDTNAVTEALPVFTLINEDKYRRYALCLGFVQTIISDFFPAASSEELRPLFRRLGNIACCIDTHLDDLDASQKEILLQEFPSFFDALPVDGTETSFFYHLSALCNRLGTSLYPPSAASMLFGFYQYCAQQGILGDLRKFSLAVICSGYEKCKANNAEAILECLQMEGHAAISFLLTLLQTENLVNENDPQYPSLKNYLHRLECMLNIADDLGDSQKDRQKGTISLVTGFGYYYLLTARLIKTFGITIARNHFLFIRHFFLFSRRYLLSEIRKEIR
ncbi:MAG: hypothetical protein GC171_01775 [Terrimonas sp.]|nr:hypothetical protein [Terrimonas sp.]